MKKYIALIAAMIVLLALTATASAQWVKTFSGTTGSKAAIGTQYKQAWLKQARIVPHPGPTSYRFKPMPGPTSY